MNEKKLATMICCVCKKEIDKSYGGINTLGNYCKKCAFDRVLNIQIEKDFETEEEELTDNRAFDLIVEFDEMGFEPTTLPPRDMSVEEYTAMWKAEMIKEIFHLQSENEKLKTELRKECEEHEEFTQKAKAEIERLTEVKEEVKQLKENLAVLKAESEKLKQSCAEAVNSFIRLETLYKVKCQELEIANKKLEELKGGKID